MLTARRLRQVLHYDPATGVFTWLMRLGPRSVVGARAGTGGRSDGYRAIQIDGAAYLEHRLAIFYTTGKWPPEDTDHKNLTKHDNVYTNIRDASRIQNRGNTLKNKNNKSGFKGVYFHKHQKRWVAKCAGKHLGYFNTAALAHVAYARAAVKRYGTYARTK